MFVVILLGVIGIILPRVRSGNQASANPGVFPTVGPNHAIFQHLLEQYVNQDGWVDYDGVGRDRKQLNDYLQQLAPAQPASFSNDRERLAFWIDAYNAYTLASVLDRVYGKVKGVREVPGFFDRERHGVAGEQLTLDQIEERARSFHDPRVHFALVCASTSCPKLQRFAYAGPELDSQLQRVLQEFLADPTKGVRMDSQHNRIFLSSIFKWYAGDFTGKPSGAGRLLAKAQAYLSGSNVIQYVREHAPKDVDRYIEDKHPSVEYLDYDWSVNSQQNHPASQGTSR